MSHFRMSQSLKHFPINNCPSSNSSSYCNVHNIFKLFSSTPPAFCKSRTIYICIKFHRNIIIFFQFSDQIIITPVRFWSFCNIPISFRTFYRINWSKTSNSHYIKFLIFKIFNDLSHSFFRCCSWNAYSVNNFPIFSPQSTYKFCSSSFNCCNNCHNFTSFSLFYIFYLFVFFILIIINNFYIFFKILSLSL